MAYQLVNNLRYGQVSSKMAGRFDLDMYSQGAKKVENFICMRQGGITRRPPAKYLVSVPSDTVRIVSMVVNTTQSVCICLSTTGFQSYTYNLAEDGTFTLVKFTDKKAWVDGYSPTENDIKEMCFAQHYSYLYVTCSNTKLGRFYLSTDTLIFQVCNVRLNYFGIDEGKKKEVKTAGFAEDTLMTSSEHYPSGCAIVSDRLILFGTKGEQDTVWWSRVLDSSQTIEESEDTLLDFVQYDVVETTTQQVVDDTSKIPKIKKLDASGLALTHTEEISGGVIKAKIYRNAESESPSFNGSFSDGKEYKLYQRVKLKGDNFGDTSDDPNDIGEIYVYQDASYTIPYYGQHGGSSNKLSDLVYKVRSIR